MYQLQISSLLSPSLSVCVTEVECVREGCQSECLRRLADSVPNSQCFTLVFRGGRKSLDLCSSSHEEARCWVQGIRTLKDRVANMSQKEKLDQYPSALLSVCICSKQWTERERFESVTCRFKCFSFGRDQFCDQEDWFVILTLRLYQGRGPAPGCSTALHSD